MFTRDQITKAAGTLGVDIPSIRAVIDVESSGILFCPEGAKTPMGLDVSGIATINFEPAVFLKRLPEKVFPRTEVLEPYRFALKKIAEDKYQIQAGFDLKFPRGNYQEYDQLDFARKIPPAPSVANLSTSWGAFQIMGFNYPFAGFSDLESFLEAHKTAEGQLQAFINFLNDQKGIRKALQKHDWVTFARLYNGPGYKKYNYDTRIERQYRKFVNENF